MNALIKAFARMDAALDKFWIGTVLLSYHEAQAARFSRMADRMATAAVEHPRVSHQALRHRLEADLLQGKI
ncbi:hypothetical protein [Pseudomonas mosselii]|uniref:hypothetical protein n=1 Tax=Pseudomonas mosselii TaxID=78327 RepID=UPI0021DA1ACA|nr:hypothetical protein [Pseudomonas mosselii]MCU9528544.1 hypothetical protein [Pseudomonas mosselii]MCU9535878.1 hypothetical protein [Pseudomonas mosselii]MCU9542936.1 hypothetical protein [Pseudomonas mosselii]MCU9548817.1 hypothetical protein [Pseudomonas mosselii]